MGKWQRFLEALGWRNTPFEGLTVHGHGGKAFSGGSDAYIRDGNTRIATAEGIRKRNTGGIRTVSIDHFAVDSNHISRKIGRLAFLELAEVLKVNAPGLSTIHLQMYRYPGGPYRRSRLTRGRIRFLHSLGSPVTAKRQGVGSFGKRSLAVTIDVQSLGLPESLLQERHRYADTMRKDVLANRPALPRE